MSRDAYIAGRSGSRSYAGSGGSSNASFQAGQQERQRDQNNRQSNQSQPKDNRSGNEKAADLLAKLQSQGKADTTQAQELKYRLAKSDAKAPQFHADGRPMSYYEKLGLADSGQIPGYMQDYYSGINPTYNKYGLPSAKLDMDAMKFGKYDMSQPMATGFGSVFGSSTGTTASSKTVQDALLKMMGQYYNKYDYNKGYYNEEGEFVPQDAIDAALDNFYPQVPI